MEPSSTELADRTVVISALIERAHAETGRLDALFNNPGYRSRRRVEEPDDGEFERMIEVRLFGAVYGMRFTIPIMRAQGSGRIVNTLSRAAKVSGPRQESATPDHDDDTR